MAAFDINGFRLSAQQKRLWLLLQENRQYSIQILLSLEGRLERQILEKAVQRVFNRHESLRTSFCSVPDIKFPLQIIAEEALLLWIDEDISNGVLDKQIIDLGMIRQREASLLPFNQEESIWRIVLIRQAQLQHKLLLTLSPLCADRISLDNLYQEIVQHYQALLQGTKPQMEEIFQYVQYGEWQYEIQTEESEEHTSGTRYWEQVLAQTGENPRLAFEQTKPEQQKNTPEFLACPLPVELCNRLKAFAQHYTMPVSEILFACFLVLLYRLGGSKNIKVGRFCDGRTDEALSSSVGLFTRCLPVRLQMQTLDSFLEVLQRISLTMEQVYRWQDYSFVVQQSVPYSGGAYLYEYGVESPERILTDLTFSRDQLFDFSEPRKLKLSCYQSASEISLEWSYDGYSFREADIKRIASYFNVLLFSACDSPQASIEALELQTRQDSALLANMMNVQYDPLIGDHPICVHTLFEIQVSSTPQQHALIYKGQKITYRELNNDANQLAHYLQKIGVEPEVRVGIYMDRSLEMVIALLAVLKAGGVYVPLDPTYPPERLEMMTQDAHVRVLVVRGQGATPTFALNAKKILLQRDKPQIACQPVTNLASNVHPDNLAYIVYTSGTTGNTKGVSVTHTNLYTYIHALQRQIEVSAEDVYGHTASFAFSSSMRQLLLPLLHGATVLIASTEQRKNPVALFETFRERHVTIWDVVPTFWRSALQLLTPDQMIGNALRLIVSASEPLKAEIVNHWRLAYKEKRPPDIFNMYGQTETAGIVSLYPLSEEETDTSIVLLGKPIACVRLYVLDQSLSPVPFCIPGDVYIGGMSLARGYSDQPALTAERFIPDMLGDIPGARLYRTGDIAYYTSDGNLKFVGRADNQIKLRGIRIAPAEVETALSMHPDVQDVVVIGREEEDTGEMQMVAYIVSRAGKEPSSSDLQAFLRGRLPDFMMPSAFILLKALPLTDTGKLDRQALAAVSSFRSMLTGTYVAPQTEDEKRLVQIWEQVLGIRPIGMDDGFIALGGHSLQAIRIVAAIQQVFHVDLSLSHFFSASRVAELLESIRQPMPEQESDTDLDALGVDLEQLSEMELRKIMPKIEPSSPEA